MKDNSISLIFSGDYHIYGNYGKVKGRFDSFIKKNPNHDLFDENFLNLMADSDFNVFNLEDPISKLRNGTKKFGPHGVGSEESLKPMAKARFNLATFANNHTYDMGNEGISETISACSKYGIDITGCGFNKEDARKIYYKTIKNVRIAILNFSRVEFNIASEKHGGANPLETIDNVRDIIEAKKNSDFVFVVVHEGLDVYHLPYPKLVKQMRFFADMGADAIILHHSRKISGYEIYNGTPIFYGLGNLLHMCKNSQEHYGLTVKFIVNKSLDFELNIIKFNGSDKIITLNGGEKVKILKEINQYSEIIKDDNKLQCEWEKYINQRSVLYLSLIMGFPRIIYRVCKKLKLLNIFRKLLIINKKKLLMILNLFHCQSHSESIMKSIESIIED